MITEAESINKQLDRLVNSEKPNFKDLSNTGMRIRNLRITAQAQLSLNQYPNNSSYNNATRSTGESSKLRASNLRDANINQVLSQLRLEKTNPDFVYSLTSLIASSDRSATDKRLVADFEREYKKQWNTLHLEKDVQELEALEDKFNIIDEYKHSPAFQKAVSNKLQLAEMKRVMDKDIVKAPRPKVSSYDSEIENMSTGDFNNIKESTLQ